MKLLLVVFREKNLFWVNLIFFWIFNSEYMIFQVNIYVMDIVWILRDVYVWRSKFMVL